MNSTLLNLWILTIVVMLLCSNAIPGAFSGALTIFYAPFVLFGFYMLTFIPQDIWLFVGLMCLFIYNM